MDTKLRKDFTQLLYPIASIWFSCVLIFTRCVHANLLQTEESGEYNLVECEIRLLEHLFNASAVPAHVRPVKRPETITMIYVSFELKTVMDMEEQMQIVKTHCGVTLDWIDEFRIWNPDAYCGLEEIDVLSKDLWLPDLSLLNSADEGVVIGPRPMTARSNGDVTWDGLVIFNSFCKIDFSFFPYDEQKCDLIFRAWSYSAKKVRLRPGEDLEKDETMDNGEWDVVQMTSVAKNTSRDGTNYSDLVITIHMERRPQFYFMNIIIPCVIIYCLTLFGFCLPPDSGEKIGLGVTILLAFVMFMLISADMMPPTAETLPVIAQFYTFTMILVASSIGMSVIVLNFNHRGPKATRAPKWMSSLFLGKLAKFLFVETDPKYAKPPAEKQQGSFLNTPQISPNQSPKRNWQPGLAAMAAQHTPNPGQAQQQTQTASQQALQAIPPPKPPPNWQPTSNLPQTVYAIQPKATYSRHNQPINTGDQIYAVPGSAQTPVGANRQPYTAGQTKASGSQTTTDQGTATSTSSPQDVASDKPQLTQRRPVWEAGPACIEKCMDDMCGNKAVNGEIMMEPNRRLSHSPIHTNSEDKSCERDFIGKQLKSISTNLQHLVDHHRDIDNDAEVSDEWKLLATAVDRLCLYIFLTASIILMITLAMELFRRNGETGNPIIEAGSDDSRFIQVGRR